MSANAPELVCLVDEPVRQALARECQALPQSTALAGLSVGVKDLIDIAQLETAAGSPDWAKSHTPPQATAHCVLQLVAAGAYITAKTQTDELAYSLNGINHNYETPVNPAAEDRLPGGSSSGSAVAAAKGTVDIGLGTDTGGSIRVPASYNGLYGLRPSHGAVSCEGLVALAPSFDTVGWLTRDFDTLKKVAQVLLPRTASVALNKLVILQPEAVNPVWSAVVDSLVTRVAMHFNQVQVMTLPQSVMTAASQAFRVLQGRQIAQQHGQWLLDTKPNIAPDIAARFQWCMTLTEEDQHKATQQAQEFKSYWQQDCAIDTNTLVALPSAPGAAPLLKTPAEDLAEYRNQLMGLTAPAGLLGAPQISLPVLQDENAPWGLSLLAPVGRDQALLAMAESLLPNLHNLKGS